MKIYHQKPQNKKKNTNTLLQSSGDLSQKKLDISWARKIVRVNQFSLDLIGNSKNLTHK